MSVLLGVSSFSATESFAKLIVLSVGLYKSLKLSIETLSFSVDYDGSSGDLLRSIDNVWRSSLLWPVVYCYSFSTGAGDSV